MRRTVFVWLAALFALLTSGCGNVVVEDIALEEGGAAPGERGNTATPPTVPVVSFRPGPQVELDDIAGIWWIETIDGYKVEWGRYAAKTPWAEFGDRRVTGNLGCNMLVADVVLHGSKARFENGSLTDVDCAEQNDAENLMWSEQVLSQIIRGPDGIEVRVDGTSMWWQGAGHTATFVARDERPELDEPPPRQQVGRLDCSPGDVVRSEVSDAGQSGEAVVAEAVTNVVTVESGDPLQWWGLDDNGEVIVGVFLGDALGAPYEIFGCE